jgi:hypothetical protein
MKKRHPRFRPGNILRVRAWAEIAARLDGSGKTDGCLFTAAMRQFCDQHIRVVKTVVTVYDEHRAEMCRTRVPLYILEGAICNGDAGEWRQRCDRSCYYLWHEDWLDTSS